MLALKLGPDPVPGLAGLVLGDADEQEGEPAQDDMGADAVLAAMVDGAQVDDLLHVSPAALDFEELLIAERDVLGGHVRVGAAQEVLAVEVLLGLDPRLAGAEEPGGGDAQEPLQSGLAGQAALDPAALGGGEAVGAVDELFELRDELRADGGVAFGLAGVVADDEPVMVVVAEADFRAAGCKPAQVRGKSRVTGVAAGLCRLHQQHGRRHRAAVARDETNVRPLREEGAARGAT